jgi:hypothetical protein
VYIQSRRHTGSEPSPYLPGREWAPENPVVDSNQTYSESEESGDAAVLATEDSVSNGAATSGTGTKSSRKGD